VEGWSVGCAVGRGVVVALGVIAVGVWGYGLVGFAWAAFFHDQRDVAGESKGVRETHEPASCSYQRNM